MKKAIAVITLIAVLVCVGVASAFTQSGTVVLPSGGGFGGAKVTIHDNFSGGNGSTFANSAGVYTFTGLQAHTYFLDATGCWLHQNYASTSNYYDGAGGPLPTIHMTALGTAC